MSECRNPTAAQSIHGSHADRASLQGAEVNTSRLTAFPPSIGQVAKQAVCHSDLCERIISGRRSSMQHPQPGLFGGARDDA